jgi:hypothetical protein
MIIGPPQDAVYKGINTNCHVYGCNWGRRGGNRDFANLHAEDIVISEQEVLSNKMKNESVCYGEVIDPIPSAPNK